MSQSVFEAIQTRRVVRQFTDEFVSNEHVRLLLEAARWAPSGGNRRLNVYIVIQDRRQIRKVRAVSPGLIGIPPLVILICIDHAKAEQLAIDAYELGSTRVDLGTALQNMLLAAHDLGLGACPVMSFNKKGVRRVLDLPESLAPEVMIIAGHPATHRQTSNTPKLPLPTVDDVTHWERYGGQSENG